jgi:hypothetical protein
MGVLRSTETTLYCAASDHVAIYNSIPKLKLNLYWHQKCQVSWGFSVAHTCKLCRLCTALIIHDTEIEWCPQSSVTAMDRTLDVVVCLLAAPPSNGCTWNGYKDSDAEYTTLHSEKVVLLEKVCRVPVGGLPCAMSIASSSPWTLRLWCMLHVLAYCTRQVYL